MNFEQWQEKYQPLLNHIDPNASFQNEAGQGIMFETYGAELVYVKAIDPRYVWTYCDEDGGYIVAGRRYVNRLGYFVCAVPHDGDEWETIELDENYDDSPVYAFYRQDDLNEDMPYAVELSHDEDGNEVFDIEWFASEQKREEFIEIWGYHLIREELPDNYVKCVHCGNNAPLTGLIGATTDNCPRCGKNVFTGEVQA